MYTFNKMYIKCFKAKLSERTKVREIERKIRLNQIWELNGYIVNTLSWVTCSV